MGLNVNEKECGMIIINILKLYILLLLLFMFILTIL